MFAGHVRAGPNDTSVHSGDQVVDDDQLRCACKLSSTDQSISRLNEVTTNRFFQSGSLDIEHHSGHSDQCHARQCQDRRGVPLLRQVMQTSALEDLEHLSLSAVELESAENQVATVKVVGGPVLPRPQDGWTVREADSFCDDFIRVNEVVQKCRGLPGVDVTTSLNNCRNDVLVRYKDVKMTLT